MSDTPRGFALRAGEEWRDQHELSRYAQRHTAAIIIAPPPSIGGEINTASGCVLSLDGRFHLVTANHVLSHFEQRIATDSAVRWQLSFPSSDTDGRLVFDPRERVSARNADEDVVAIELAADEVQQVGARACSTPLGWPPPALEAGDFLVLSGYPCTYREHVGSQISFPALCAVFEAGATGVYHAIWQWDRERMVNLSGATVPAYALGLGGMSGGPVFLIGELAYPLIGVITDFNSEWELLRVAHLGALHPTASPSRRT